MNCDMSFTVLIKLKYTFIVGLHTNYRFYTELRIGMLL